MTPTYGNTLMGLACSKPVTAEDGYKITYYAPQPRAVAEVVDFDDPLKLVPYGDTRPRDADHAHQRILHPRLPGTRRRRAREAVRQISLGRRQRREAVARNCGADDGGRVLISRRNVDRVGDFICDCVCDYAYLFEQPFSFLGRIAVLKIPVLRWGKPYESLEVDEVKHFITGEPIAKVSQANGGIIGRDMRTAQKARDILRQIPIAELLEMVKKAGDLYEKATLPIGDGTQTPDEFAHQQSASTGLPEHMCKMNMAKNAFVLANMDKILDCLTRGLRSEHPHQGLGHGEPRRGGQLSGPGAGARRGAAVEFARRAYALAAGHSAAARPGAQARPAGAVDAVPHDRGLHPGRHSGGSVWRSIPAAPKRARRCSSTARGR